MTYRKNTNCSQDAQSTQLYRKFHTARVFVYLEVNKGTKECKQECWKLIVRDACTWTGSWISPVIAVPPLNESIDKNRAACIILIYKLNKIMEEYTAGIVIVGDEILRGQVTDRNTSYLAKKLAAIGIKLRKVVTIPDVVNEIADEVHLASKKFSVVFTAGGVGPTHDDVTYSAVAKSLGLKLEENKELVTIYAELFLGKSEARRLAKVPSPCEIIYVPSSVSTNLSGKTYPVIKVANVYVLPGSPLYFSQAVDVIVPQLPRGTPVHTDFIDVNLEELAFVDILDDFAKRWEGQLSIGSYPQAESTTITRITIEGGQSAVQEAKMDLQSALISREISSSKQFTLSHARAVEASSKQQPHIKTAMDILQRCYDESPDAIFVNFNGGKDCTAVLYLLATVVKLRGAPPPVCLYVSDDPFPEVDEFVDNAVNFYGLEILKMKGSIREALQLFLDSHKNLKTGIMGMRRGDPGADKLDFFSPTDNGWPSMVRVNPILDWTYKQVWDFLIKHNVSYCSLYDQGYTSIGARATTKPNPLLRDPNNPTQYLPAYTLTNDSLERHGRG
ncbi:FAD synthase-like isoform X1 [Neodiprion virginianus]|uniref:FAD synthase-like isoform X1 n=2 Tax=Neodiprion virginianus TaxID=2961670 RepID=UPI001EE72F58|nr:FAD synthase-like isoform X1 [Neodiprion virginianus]